MIRTFIISFYLLASFYGMGQAIKFGTFGIGFNNTTYNPVRSLFYDTIDKKLYAGGQFTYADNKTVWGAAVWNGIMWDSLSGGFTKYPQIPAQPNEASDFAWKIVRYKNKIYFAGAITWVNGKNQYNLAVWNGNSWDYPLPQPLSSNSQIFDMIVHKDTLYVCGLFTMIGSVPCNYVAKFDGTNWQPVGDFAKFEKNSQGPAQMNAIAVYNNEIYVGGAFDDSTGTPRNIAKFNGSNWVNVGNGIRQGGIAWVADLEEINDKLYIAGYFGRTQEIPGESFVAWNSFEFEDQYSDILSGGFRSFYKSNDKLFILASFYDSNHTPFQGIKFITSTKKCLINSLHSTFTNTLNYSVNCMESINDSLIVGGLYKFLDTISANNIGVITNYENNSSCLVTKIKENYFDNNNIKIYPNPVKEILNIEFEVSETSKIELAISNSLGQIVHSLNQLNQKQEIDLSFLPSGIYFLKLQNDSGQKVFKIIRE